METLFTLELGCGFDSINATVTIFGITSTEPIVIDSFTMSSSQYTWTSSNTESTYLYAKVSINRLTHRGDNAPHTVDPNTPFELLSIFKSDEPNVAFNERLTVANMYCFARSIRFDDSQNFVIVNDEATLKVSLAMRNNFMHGNGDLSTVISSSPNNFETNSFALWNSLANLTCECLIDKFAYLSFLVDTTVDPQAVPTSFLSGLYNIVQNPFHNVSKLYDLILGNTPNYTPTLPGLDLPTGHKNQPDQFTLTIKVNKSGADNFLIAGAAQVVFDKNDNAWLANNVRQGTPNSAPYCMVFNPDGSPTDFSPVFGGGTLGVGFGVCVDNTGENVYYGSFGWGPTQCNPQNGGISHFSTDGTAISGPDGYTEELSRVQGLDFDSDGNLWITSWGNQEPLAPAKSIYNFKGQDSAIVVYLDGDPKRALYFNFLPKSQYYNTFDVTINTNGDAYVSLSGHSDKNPHKCAYSGVYKVRINADKTAIDFVAKWDITTDPNNFQKCEGYDGFRQINLDTAGNVFVGAINEKSNRVIKLDANLNYIREYSEKINRPWSVTLDYENTIFAGNFGPELKENPIDGAKHEQLPVGSTGVTVIKHDASGNPTYNLMTLPTGGEDVHLANGFPLYGIITTKEHQLKDDKSVEIPVTHPCYTPLMRITSSTIDRAGNLWVMNNWKPSAAVDLLENPGGDGIVIFVGVAAPHPSKFD